MTAKILLACTILFLLAFHGPFLFLASATASQSTTIRVPEDYPTIQLAINNANNGTTIIVSEGTYNEQLTINKTITLIGAGINKSILNGTQETTAIQIIANNITIQGFTIQNFKTGIIINQSHNIFIAENQITKTWTKGAICILRSTNITISNNTITNNNCPGISMFKSNKTRFLQNTIEYNYAIGISFDYCNYFTAIGNHIILNAGDAVYCTYSYNLHVEENTFALNDYRGIWAVQSNGTIYHNNFIRNRENARTIQSNITWDNGYPSGGNYWSNYTGSDLNSGVDQNQNGSDGIGDMAFTIPQEDEQDKYPLMGNFTTQQITVETQNYKINFISNSKISNPYINVTEKSLYFTISNPNESQGFCRIIIPKNLMRCDNQDEWKVEVNATLPERTIIEDANYTYIYFTFPQGLHQIRVKSTFIAPEVLVYTPVFLIIVFVTAFMKLIKKKQTRAHFFYEIFFLQIKTKTYVAKKLTTKHSMHA